MFDWIAELIYKYSIGPYQKKIMKILLEFGPLHIIEVYEWAQERMKEAEQVKFEQEVWDKFKCSVCVEDFIIQCDLSNYDNVVVSGILSTRIMGLNHCDEYCTYDEYLNWLDKMTKLNSIYKDYLNFINEGK